MLKKLISVSKFVIESNNKMREIPCENGNQFDNQTASLLGQIIRYSTLMNKKIELNDFVPYYINDKNEMWQTDNNKVLFKNWNINHIDGNRITISNKKQKIDFSNIENQWRIYNMKTNNDLHTIEDCINDKIELIVNNNFLKQIYI